MNKPIESEHASAQANQIQRLWTHLRDDLPYYLGGAGFIVVVLLFTGFYRLASESKHRDLSSEYARAVLLEDPAERAEALASLSAKNSTFAPRALYLRGEALLSARDYESAAAVFTELRETYPDFQHVPDAVEGLGFLEEDQGNTEAAIEVYREVLQKWPNSPAGRRQPFNIARCLEEIGDIQEAIDSYREQLGVFPGSSISTEAQQRLVALRVTHPDYFDDGLGTVAAVGAVQDTPAEREDKGGDGAEGAGQAESTETEPADGTTEER